MLRVDRILAGPETAQNADVLSLSQSDLIGTGLILRVTGLRQIQVWINYTVRLELCMVVDLMELMQHMNDTHAYESAAKNDMLLLTSLRNWHITSLPTLRKLASKTQRRHITWERQDLQHKMTRYEGFRYNPLVERDVITLLNDWPYELQDISDQNIGVTLGKVTPTSRERILSFVDNRGDFKTFKHELFFIIEYLDESCFFVIRHHPDPAVFRSSSNCTLIRVAHHMVIVRRNRRRKEP